MLALIYTPAALFLLLCVVCWIDTRKPRRSK